MYFDAVFFVFVFFVCVHHTLWDESEWPELVCKQHDSAVFVVWFKCRANREQWMVGVKRTVKTYPYQRLYWWTDNKHTA